MQLAPDGSKATSCRLARNRQRSHAQRHHCQLSACNLSGEESQIRAFFTHRYDEKDDLGGSRGVPHRHDFFEPIWLTEGAGRLTCDLKTWTFEPGTLFFAAPGRTHCWQSTATARGYVFGFKDEYLQRGVSDAGSMAWHLQLNLSEKPLLTLAPEHREEMTQLFSTLAREADRQGSAQDCVVRNYGLIILTKVRQWLELAAPGAGRQVTAQPLARRSVPSVRRRTRAENRQGGRLREALANLALSAESKSQRADRHDRQSGDPRPLAPRGAAPAFAFRKYGLGDRVLAPFRRPLVFWTLLPSSPRGDPGGISPSRTESRGRTSSHRRRGRVHRRNLRVGREGRRPYFRAAGRLTGRSILRMARSVSGPNCLSQASISGPFFLP